MFRLKGLIVSMLLILSATETTWAQAKGYMSQRAEAREKSRWTLQEWLEQRDRNRMMDLWLSMNSPSPYEGMIGAAYKSYLRDVDTPKTERSFNSGDGYLTFHASIIGITVEYENNLQENYNDLSGMLNLRIFGNSIQSTALTIHYGQRTRTNTLLVPSEAYKNQFGQVSLQLYLFKYFGIDGSYRAYIPMSDETLHKEVRGSLTEAGAFIDFKTIRIFGAYFQDVEVIRDTLTPFNEVTTKRSGSKAGLKLFF